MGWTGKQTDNGDGTKHVQVTDENGDVIFDVPDADSGTVFNGPVEWA
nr:hypothetical protein [Kibdelosporangium sp. MJ126-NF4]CEL15084.1 hypothetical protein [Kibdelosporangium sp. MJ126-NF4]CTQ93322.1 hypothetical protein [Kibdelosporangium sp. MJ126-NF4]